MEEIYSVKKLKNNEEFTITVPGSKSVTNRALMLAALAKGKCVLEGVLFSDDSRAFLDCLEKLGFELEINEETQTVSVVGLGGRNSKQKLHNKCAQCRNSGKISYGNACFGRVENIIWIRLNR